MSVTLLYITSQRSPRSCDLWRRNVEVASQHRASARIVGPNKKSERVFVYICACLSTLLSNSHIGRIRGDSIRFVAQRKDSTILTHNIDLNNFEVDFHHQKQARMKVAICSNSLGLASAGHRLEDKLKAAKAAGIQGIEVG